MSGIEIRLKAFEGPLDLLLHLLEKNKVSIYDIPIVEITDQYLEHISEMPGQDLNIMSEFLVMAATLLDIKSRWLLPKEETDKEEEEDPRRELAGRLLEYKMYKAMALTLAERHAQADRSFWRGESVPGQLRAYAAPPDLSELTKGCNVRILGRIFSDVMRRQAQMRDARHAEYGTIEQEKLSLDERISSLNEYVARHRKISFRAALCGRRRREDVIVTFLAVLELMRTGRITIEQKRPFDEITITAAGSV